MVVSVLAVLLKFDISFEACFGTYRQRYRAYRIEEPFFIEHFFRELCAVAEQNNKVCSLKYQNAKIAKNNDQLQARSH